jgi:hypothetical protein
MVVPLSFHAGCVSHKNNKSKWNIENTQTFLIPLIFHHASRLASRHVKCPYRNGTKDAKAWKKARHTSAFMKAIL